MSTITEIGKMVRIAGCSARSSSKPWQTPRDVSARVSRLGVIALPYKGTRANNQYTHVEFTDLARLQKHSANLLKRKLLGFAKGALVDAPSRCSL